jgi:uncharacterized protein
MRIIRFCDLTETPWKNGGGITREIAQVQSGQDLIWRLSMADVSSDGVFSNFAGLMRILTVIEGDGMELTSPAGTLQADLGVPAHFDGALEIEAKLKGSALRDFNLMFDPLHCDCDATVIQGPYRQLLQTDPLLTYALHCFAGSVDFTKGDQRHPGDTALIDTGSVRVALPEGASSLLLSLKSYGYGSP